MVDPFDDRRDALADTDAHGGKAVAAAALAHFMDQRRHDARAAATERMAEGNGTAVDVQLIGSMPSSARAGENLRGESFVQFDQIDLLDRQAGALQGFLSRRIGPMPI